MRPVRFEGADDVLAAPAGAEDQIDALPVLRLEDPPRVVSCWQLTDAELEAVTRFRRVYVTVLGETTYPLFVAVEPPAAQGGRLPEVLLGVLLRWLRTEAEEAGGGQISLTDALELWAEEQADDVPLGAAAAGRLLRHLVAGYPALRWEVRAGEPHIVYDPEHAQLPTTPKEDPS